jgi:type IV secretion system protein VirB10
MSASTQPYSAAARGRLPMRPLARVLLLGSGLLICMLVAMYFLVMPAAQIEPTAPTSTWSAGPPMILPAIADAQAPAAAPAPASAAPPVPGPVVVPSEGIRPMQVWGADSGSLLQHAAGKLTGEASGGAGGAEGAAGQHDGDRPGDQPGNGGTEYASRLTPTATTEGEANVYKDISLLLAESTMFGCLPQSPIDTQLVGGVSCIVDENVWSADGSNILIDKGAVVSGEIQRGLEQGQDRAFILWRSVRSKRVYASLDSPAVDELGQMGVPGEVNEHLWRKIKASLLLTGVQGLANAGQAYASRGNGNSYVNFSSGESLASQSLAHDINIPTTLWRGQAWPLKVYVQHPVFFHRAYNNVLMAGVK